jgi:hypothetical protein
MAPREERLATYSSVHGATPSRDQPISFKRKGSFAGHEASAGARRD